MHPKRARFMDTSPPPSKRRRQKENVPDSSYAKSTSVKMGRGKHNKKSSEPTLQARRLSTTTSNASLASMVSTGTAFPETTALADCSNLRPRQRLDETTSPRKDSRLARRPKEQFPCSLQPFRIIVPLSVDGEQGVSVAEANRRIQQAQVLSERQQHFDQLIDLASTGYLPERQCGDAPDAAAAVPQAANAQAQQAGAVPPQAQQPPPPPAAVAAPVAAPAPAPGPRRLVSRMGGTTLPSRTGHGCIRIMRME